MNSSLIHFYYSSTFETHHLRYKMGIFTIDVGTLHHHHVLFIFTIWLFSYLYTNQRTEEHNFGTTITEIGRNHSFYIQVYYLEPSSKLTNISLYAESSEDVYLMNAIFKDFSHHLGIDYYRKNSYETKRI